MIINLIEFFAALRSSSSKRLLAPLHFPGFNFSRRIKPLGYPFRRTNHLLLTNHSRRHIPLSAASFWYIQSRKMASVTSTALTKRPSSDLMGPPPLPKRIKRPPKVLDEDDYTEALSQIIARDFFPGLAEQKSQKEYLDALESNDPVWIASAGKNLQKAMTPRPEGRGVATRLKAESTTAFNSVVGDQTPRGWQGATPVSVAGTDQFDLETEPQKPEIDTRTLSLSAFQAKYTSEDNESFNALLDKQNIKRREKYTFLWNDNKIPAPRQIAHRAREAKLLKDKEDNAGPSNALALTTGATSSRPARPEAWKSKPNNNLMFQPSSIDDDGLETVADRAQAESRAPPKQTLYHNTRLPLPPQPPSSHDQPPPSPSLSAISSAIAGHPRGPPSSTASLPPSSIISGSETPRINGYSFVDDDEPQPEPQPPSSADNAPSYRDLLAGQTSSSSPSPFQIHENRKRESLHHRMVEKTNRRKREKRLDTIKTPVTVASGVGVPRFASSPFVGGGRTPADGGGSGGGAGTGRTAGAGLGAEGMTPAAKRLWEKVGGKTPRVDSGIGSERGSALKNMWTPTPRRKA